MAPREEKPELNRAKDGPACMTSVRGRTEYIEHRHQEVEQRTTDAIEQRIVGWPINVAPWTGKHAIGL